MKNQILFKDLPCIKDKAYFIMVAVSGSWLYEATWPNNQDDKWCENFVKSYLNDHSLKDYDVQTMVDDSYEDIVKYRKGSENKLYTIMKRTKSNPSPEPIVEGIKSYLLAWELIQSLKEISSDDVSYYSC